MRQVVLDTETTGMKIEDNNRIIEIGCVEIQNRRLTGNNFHVYINPERESEEGALEVHGLTSEFLSDKPLFNEVAQDFVDYISGAELIIHNAAFDVAFINHELKMLQGNQTLTEDICSVVDSLAIAKKKHPGQKNNLDALCKRYNVDNSNRELHGALLDAELLADVFLLMTGGQKDMAWEGEERGEENYGNQSFTHKLINREGKSFPVLQASGPELEAHELMLEEMSRHSEDLVWSKLAES